ncbi:MAG TPA: hypothetical protein VH210_13760 [Gaiellaceae bacterium]|nr:hypothetical protein [Gaiellaceae bacterium]
MNRATSLDDYRAVEAAADGSLLLDLLTLQGWEIHVTVHDLGVKVVGQRDADEIIRHGGSVAQIAVDFFKAAHHAAHARVAPVTEELQA